MRSCGVIAEYNPFHNGHRWHLQEARRLSRADVLVVAMSGNFTQRGEPALLDKWRRTAVALANGADVVLEHPVLGSVQPADFFAKSGVRLLKEAGCQALAFGAESGTPDDFGRMARIMQEREQEINAAFQALRNDGTSYPAQMEEAVRRATGEASLAHSFWTPNNQLGLAYARENVLLPEAMELIVVERRGAQHHDAAVPQTGSFASATALRQKIRNGEELSAWVPSETVHALLEANPVGWEDYWPFLRYRLTVEPAEQIRGYYQVEEGIEHRLKVHAASAPSFQSFMGKVKNKRWTWTRLQRVCLAILLGIRREQVGFYYEHSQPLRLLGFTPTGREYLREQKKKGAEWLSRIGKVEQDRLELEISSDRVYQQAVGKLVPEQNFGRTPLYLR